MKGKENEEVMNLRGNGRFRSRRFVIVAVIAIGIVAAIIAAAAGGGRSKKTAEIKEGVAFLKAQESKDPKAVEQVLTEQKKAKMQAERAEMQKKLEDGTIDVWSLFGDSVIMGDSRAVGFYTFEFLPQSRVLADAGNTIANIKDHEDELVQLNPANLFLCYGLNDISIGLWKTKEDYVKDYASILDELHKKLPDTSIFVNSIIPAQQPAIDSTPAWGNIPEWSDAVHQMVKEKGFGWVDVDGLVSEHQDLYDPDSIHVQRDFYPLWATQMMLSVYDEQQAQGDGSEDVVSSSDDDAAVSSESIVSASSENVASSSGKSSSTSS